MEYGRRYTLVTTWVRRHESMVRVLRRMVARIREIGLKIRRVLLDRGFFNAAIVALLQEEKLPFVMPVVIRGRAPKKGTYGDFMFNAASGVWTYTLNNSDPDTNALTGGQQVTDRPTIVSLDGTASQEIVVTSTGANDIGPKLVGRTLMVFGADTANRVEWSGSDITATVDGQAASYAAADIDTVEFHGGIAGDTLVCNGDSSNETAKLWSGHAEFTHGGQTITVTCDSVELVQAFMEKGSDDRVEIYGTDVADTAETLGLPLSRS